MAQGHCRKSLRGSNSPHTVKGINSYSIIKCHTLKQKAQERHKSIFGAVHMTDQLSSAKGTLCIATVAFQIWSFTWKYGAGVWYLWGQILECPGFNSKLHSCCFHWLVHFWLKVNSRYFWRYFSWNEWLQTFKPPKGNTNTHKARSGRSTHSIYWRSSSNSVKIFK